MSGSGAPEQSAPHARGMRVTVVAAQWHERIMGGLVAGALRAVEEAGAQASVIRAVGSFELPVLAAAAARGGGQPVHAHAEKRILEGRPCGYLIRTATSPIPPLTRIAPR